MAPTRPLSRRNGRMMAHDWCSCRNANWMVAIKWSPNGEQIISLSYRSLDGTDSAIAGANIWVVNADGSDLKPLTHTTAKDVVDAQNAQWSPDGKHVAFTSSQTQDNVNATGASNIWLIDANGTNLHSVVTSAASTVGAFCL